jgi:hypothetical protein
MIRVGDGLAQQSGDAQVGYVRDASVGVAFGGL